MKLTHIRNVLAVAEYGSMRGAARTLGIAQPAITRSIREVEAELGVTLFERYARGMMLTAIGERFVRRAERIQFELHRVKDEIEQLKGSRGGSVTVGLSTVPHLTLLPKALGPFRARFGEADLTVEEGLFTRMRSDLESGRLDFYVGPLPETKLPATLISEMLFENERVIFCRKGHPLARATTLAELKGGRWITTSVTMDSEAELAPLFARHGLEAPVVAMKAPSALTMIIAAAHSDLLAMLPQQWLDFPAIPALLDRIPIAEPLPAPSLCIVRRADLPLAPAAEYLADLMRRTASNIAIG
jgi:DNA-binding transcriptional LysR family regulator